MKTKKVLTVVFFFIALLLLGAAIYFSLLPVVAHRISLKLGFLIFMPIWIAAYWFSVFFYQISKVKSGDGFKRAIPKKLFKFMNGLLNFISFALLAYWLIMYIIQCRSYKN